VPVLAEQAIERTAMVENRQIFVSIAILLSTNPFSHTIGWQWIVIPSKAPSFSIYQVDQLSQMVSSQATIAKTSLGNLAFVGTDTTFHSSLIPGNLLWKAKIVS